MTREKLIERNGCIFDAEQLTQSHGYERLDPVGQEAFVNHIHLDGSDREKLAARIVTEWETEMRAKWPGATFRIYVHRDARKVTIRFHRHRAEIPDWSSEEATITVVT